MWRRLAVIAAVIALAGCAEQDAPDLTRCLDVRPELLTSIESGLTVTGGGELRDGQAVRSGDYDEVYFVSAEIVGEGIESGQATGTWATNDLSEDLGLVFAVDAIAKEFSSWGADAGQIADQLSMSDDGAEESQACVQVD